jgi:hypothetical protein
LPTKPLSTRAVLAIAALSLPILALASCAKDATGDTPGDVPGASGGSGGGTTDASLDQVIIVTPTPDADTPKGDGNMHPNLPPPWQFYKSPGADADMGSPSGVFAYKDSASPFNAQDLFKGAVDGNANDTPLIVYPLDGSMHPMNLSLMTFQWNQANSSNTLFRIETKVGGATFDFYVTCAAGQCQFPMPESEWLDLGLRFAGQTLTFTLAGSDGKGGVVATSAPIKLSFSPSQVNGGLYYWASSLGTIERATFGSSKAVPYLTPGDKAVGLENTKCVACHSVSRDGKTTAYTVTSPPHTVGGNTTDAPWGVFVAPTENLAKPLANPLNGSTDGMVKQSFGSYPALSADGSLLALNLNQNGGVFLEVRDTATGASLDKQGAKAALFGAPEAMALHPEWSPDGKNLAVTLTTIPTNWACYWDHLTCWGTIGIMPWDGTAKKLGAAVPLVKSAAGSEGSNHFYPTWSPDGKWIAFVSARPALPGETTPQSSYDAKDSVLRMIPSDLAGAPYECPGPKCVELTNATRYTWATAMMAAGRGSTFPKFTPFAQGANKDLFFISYSSRINYGFTQSPDLHQLWMAAIDMSVVASGAVDDAGSPADPSYAPLWVPYQATTEKNVEPYWTEVLSCSIDPKGGCQGCVGGEDCKIDENNDCFCAANVK